MLGLASAAYIHRMLIQVSPTSESKNAGKARVYGATFVLSSPLLRSKTLKGGAITAATNITQHPHT